MDAGRLGPLLKGLRARLRDPLQLRVAVALALVLGWQFGVYPTFRDGIEAADRRAADSKAHADLARAIEDLRREAAKYRDRLTPGADPNEFAAYVLGGLRDRRLRVLRFDPQPSAKFGPFGVGGVKVELAGAYPELDAMLAWIDANPRLLRVDSIALEPGRAAEAGASLRLTILGMMR